MAPDPNQFLSIHEVAIRWREDRTGLMFWVTRAGVMP
jgi:hypothetical protein